MPVSIDTSSMLKSRKVEQKDLSQFVDNVSRKVGLEILSGIVQENPVDSGRSRAAWLVTIDKPDTDSVPDEAEYKPHQGEGKDPKGSAADTVSKGASVMTAAKGIQQIHIQNNVEYIVYLNEGSSIQAPEAFVENNINRVVGGL